MVELNRRTFLSGSVAAGAAALFGTEAAHAAGAVKLPTKWDETADVVIVGSGFAGLAAAIEPENRGIYTQSDSSKKSSRNIWSLAVVSVDQRY